jgi:hypothetical protein
MKQQLPGESDWRRRQALMLASQLPDNPACWALRPGRYAYCSGGRLASKIGCSTSIAAVMQTPDALAILDLVRELVVSFLQGGAPKPAKAPVVTLIRS